MALSKEKLRKIYGVKTVKVIEDPVVISRRIYHKFFARWCAKWCNSIIIIFSYIGFFLLILPMFWKDLRIFIENTWIIRKFFYDFSTFTGTSLIALYFLIGLFILKNLLQLNSFTSPSTSLTYKNIVEMELYPVTKKQELIYFVDIIYGIIAAPMFVLFLFSLFAFLIR